MTTIHRLIPANDFIVIQEAECVICKKKILVNRVPLCNDPKCVMALFHSIMISVLVIDLLKSLGMIKK